MAVIPGFIPEGASGVAPFLNAVTIYGGRASGGNMTLGSTSHATKGKIIFGTSAYDEANNRLGIGTTSPDSAFVVSEGLIKSSGLTTMGLVADFTGGKAASLIADIARASILFDDSGRFSIQARTRTNVLAGSGAEASVLIDLTAAGLLGIGTTAANEKLDLYAGNLQFSNTSTTNKQRQSIFTPSWVDSTNATRKARVIWSIYDTASREAMRVEASGTAPMIGFLGASAAARQTLNSAATDAATTQTLVNQIRSALITFGLCS